MTSMNELRPDAAAFYKWAQAEHNSEDIDRLIFDLESTLEQLNKAINEKANMCPK
jgi:hypothetical protein